MSILLLNIKRIVMKIISKCWDFYDIVGPYDETEPVYVRTPEYFRYTYQDRNGKSRLFEDALNEFVDATVKKPLYRFRNRLPYGMYVGIFPEVYLVPIVAAAPDDYWNSDYDTIPGTVMVHACEDPRYSEFFALKRVESSKIRDLFFTLGVPVFVWTPRKNCVRDKKYVEYDEPVACSLITNPIIQNLKPGILPYLTEELELDPIKTYNNIESFLWATKTEPVSELPDAAKIVSHGFDTKTSFRNVK